MFNRRVFLQAAASTASVFLSGFYMNNKKNIKNFGKAYDYLKYPDLRRK